MPGMRKKLFILLIIITLISAGVIIGIKFFFSIDEIDEKEQLSSKDISLNIPNQLIHFLNLEPDRFDNSGTLIKKSNNSAQINEEQKNIIDEFEKTIENKIVSSPTTKPDLIQMIPSNYLQNLNDWQNQMINDGDLAKEEKFEFDNFNNVVNFLEKMTVNLIDQKVIVEEKKDDLLYGLKIVWPSTLIMEQGLSLNDAQKNIFSSIAGIVKWFKKSLFPDAFGVICFKPGGTPAPTGVNMWAPCCACYAGYTPIGCLNSVCTGGAAIYDSITGICGCG